MANTTECVTNNVVESINKRTRIDLSKCKDDRDHLKIGDSVAMLFFNDPNYHAGKLENISGKLGIPIGKISVGLVDDADHVVKINK